MPTHEARVIPLHRQLSGTEFHDTLRPCPSLADTDRVLYETISFGLADIARDNPHVSKKVDHVALVVHELIESLGAKAGD